MKRLIFLLLIARAFALTNIDMTMGNNQRLMLNSKTQTIYLENPSVADYEFHEPNWVILKAKSSGATKLYNLNKDGKLLSTYNIVVHYPISEIQIIAKNLFPSSSIKLNSIPKYLIIRGSVDSSKQHKEFMQQVYKLVPRSQVIDKIKFPSMDVNEPSRQINLRVRIVEVKRLVSKALGVKWDLIAKSGTRDMFSFKGPESMEYNMFSNGTLTNKAIKAGENTFSTNILINPLSITAMLDLLESDQYANTVQEPNLTVKAGEEASFVVGGSVPINRPQTSQFNSGTVAYKDYGIKLSYKAEFDQDDPKLVKLSVSPEVSEVLSYTSKDGNPALAKKEAKTVVELRSGQSMAIAGLVASETISNKNSVPGADTLPVVGAAFRSENFVRQEKEIVFVITPYIVHATQNGMIEDQLDSQGMPKMAQESGFLIGDN